MTGFGAGLGIVMQVGEAFEYLPYAVLGVVAVLTLIAILKRI